MRISALSLSACLIISPAFALDVYDDNVNLLSVGGHAGIGFANTGGDNALVDSSSRVRFHFARQMRNGWQSEALMEWGFNLVDSGTKLQTNGDSFQSIREGDFLFSRQGFLAFSHESYGRFSAGKQWSVYYDVAGITDYFIFTGGLASGTYNFDSDGGLSGTGRADNALQYRNSVAGLKIGLQYQAKGEGTISVICDPETTVTPCDELDALSVDYDDSWGLSLVYPFYDFSIGVAYNRGDFESSRAGKGKDEAWIVGFSYGELYRPGAFLALNYADSENHEIDHQNVPYDANGYELMFGYTFAGDATLVAGLNRLESSDSAYEEVNGDYLKNLYVIGVHYQWGSQLRVFAEIKIDDSEFGFEKTSEENLYGVGARYFF
ncbi:porin [Ferrimonas gelatinilytica]|uniref:Porin n=1 Tax=Ferrimonas gelatinilytica TaxID=1255257 RepID=A0ABP9RYB0_9GAMM